MNRSLGETREEAVEIARPFAERSFAADEVPPVAAADWAALEAADQAAEPLALWQDWR